MSIGFRSSCSYFAVTAESEEGCIDHADQFQIAGRGTVDAQGVLQLSPLSSDFITKMEFDSASQEKA